MKAHELAQKLLEGPDLEVHTWYDGQHIPMSSEDLSVIAERQFPQDPEPPYLLIT